MVRFRWIFPLSLLACSLTSGCALTGEDVVPAVSPARVPGAPPTTVLPVAAGPLALPDQPARLSAWPEPAQLPKGERVKQTYRGLDAFQCRCLAVRNSALARSLDARRAAIQARSSGHPDDLDHKARQSEELLDLALAFEAVEARNDDAGKALELFFRLAQAETQDAILSRSQAELAGALEAAQAKIERGLPVQEEYEKLKSQGIDLRDQQAALTESIERVNSALKTELGLGPADEPWRIRPLMNWEVRPEVPETGAAVSLGLASRPQLLLLRTALNRCSQETLPVAGQILGSINPLLGVEIHGSFLFEAVVSLSTSSSKLHHEESDSVSETRGRIERVLAWRERTVSQEIRDALLGIDSRVRRVAIARDRHVMKKEEIDHLEAKAERGLTPSLALSAARLELWKAQSQWVDEAIELNIQRTKLERAQGLLPQPCCGPR